MKVAVIGGDGTGPEVIKEALKALTCLAKLFKFTLEFDNLNYDGTRYLNENKLLSDTECENLKSYDAILLGAIGHVDLCALLLLSLLFVVWVPTWQCPVVRLERGPS